jgi:hypothetical protein
MFALQHFDEFPVSYKMWDGSDYAFRTEVKREVVGEIRILYPVEAPTPTDLQKLKSMIEKEEDKITKAKLISVLAVIGEKDTAIRLVERDIFPLLLEPELSNRREAEQLILSLGEISSPKIKEILLSVYRKHPDLVLEIGDVFVRKNFYSEEIIEKLKKLLNDAGDETPENPGEPAWRRTYAALLLILMNEPIPSSSQ